MFVFCSERASELRSEALVGAITWVLALIMGLRVFLILSTGEEGAEFITFFEAGLKASWSNIKAWAIYIISISGILLLTG